MFNYALVVHILINIAIIAKCKYIEREIALAKDEKYLRNDTEIVFVSKSTTVRFSPKLFYTLAVP